MISRKWLSILMALAAGLPALGGFDDDFGGATMRVDYRHTGTAAEEHFALERIRIEGLWAGSKTQLIDPTNLGKYLVEVVDLASNRLIYSRGFASIFGEWETTAEAGEGIWRSIGEAVRIPEPKRPAQLRIRKRRGDQSFSEIWSLTIDPDSRFVDRPPAPEKSVLDIMIHGDPSTKVDLLVLGDGYAAGEMEKFAADVRRLIAEMFKIEPFRARKSDFNVRAIGAPAVHSGISRPRAGVFRQTALGTRYNAFDSERYILTLEDSRWRDVAAAAPYEFVLILVNERKYGGGGIFNLYSTAAADSAFAAYLVVHEFGHHFAGLADEYFTSDVAYEEDARRVEPWEPNATALADPSRLKWKDLVEKETELPTRWDKSAFEESSLDMQARRRALRAEGAAELELEKLFEEERTLLTRMLENEPYAGKVGAFEGAMYASQGLFRPTVDCIMFTRNEAGFCPVCTRAIERVIDLYAR